MQHQTRGLAEVTLQATPSIQPAQPQRLTFSVRDARSNRPVDDIVEAHERVAHLIVVRRDLERFQHLHPEATREAGVYEADVTFPEPGDYLLFPEFQRANGEHIVGRIQIRIGEPGETRNAALLPQAGPLRVGDHLVSLSPSVVRAGEQTRFTLHIAEAATGEGVTDLQRYLAAAAHIVILDEAAERFGHAHGSDAREHEPHGGHHAEVSHSTPSGQNGPDIVFSHRFALPGLYRLWVQYLPASDRVETASFVVTVE